MPIPELVFPRKPAPKDHSAEATLLSAKHLTVSLWTVLGLASKPGRVPLHTLHDLAVSLAFRNPLQRGWETLLGVLNKGWGQ